MHLCSCGAVIPEDETACSDCKAVMQSGIPPVTYVMSVAYDLSPKIERVLLVAAVTLTGESLDTLYAMKPRAVLARMRAVGVNPYYLSAWDSLFCFSANMKEGIRVRHIREETSDQREEREDRIVNSQRVRKIDRRKKR